MKINFQKITLVLALALVGGQAAHADLGIEQSRTFNSGGGSTTMKMGVAPSDFDPMQIAYKLTTAGGEVAELWAMTPEQPTPASQQAAQMAVINGANLMARSTPFGLSGLGGTFLTSVTGWVAWGIQQGFIAPDYYSRVLASCLVRESGNTSQDGLMFRRQGCQVEAYIKSYAMNPKGYAGGNLMGLVPLCEVQQQNDCNITGGSFDPMARLQQMQAARAAEDRQMQAQLRWNAVSMHSQKFVEYLGLKHCKSERDTGKLDAKAYQQCVNESISAAVIGIQR